MDWSVVHTKRAVCRVSETWTEEQSTRCRSSQERYSTKSSPTAPTRTGSRPRLPSPKQMFAAHPPRRTSRSSTRNETDSLSSWSTTRLSENLPGKDIKWSVAMDPAMRRGTAEQYPRARLDPHCCDAEDYRSVRIGLRA